MWQKGRQINETAIVQQVENHGTVTVDWEVEI